MHELYELKELLCKELEEYGRKGDLTAGSLEVIDKLAHALKNLDKIIETKEMESEDDYSMASSYEGGGMGNMGGSSNRGGSNRGSGGSSRNSYARGGGRGRGRNAKRDSMGRYSSESRRYSRDGGMNRYSREGGYSYADDMQEMADSIRDMMQELPQDVQQDAQRFVQKLEQTMM